MPNYLNKENLIKIMQGISKKVPQGIMLGNAPVGHIEWQMYLQRDYLKLDGTPLANASNDYDELLKFAQDNSLITSDTTDKSLFKYDSTNDVLTLPDYIGLCLQGGNTVEEKEAGLPNVIGSFINANGYVDCIRATGAFTSQNSGRLAGWGGSGGNFGGVAIATHSLDASLSNPIYGNSITVQPPAITLIPQIKYIKGTTVWEELDFNKLMPLGTIINFMGTTAPDYYLACDGTIYNILEYSALANFFEVQFGSKNFFGGNGTTTFAVPDLRGEFLRGTGTNSHTNQGSGASVGVHQDGTEHVGVYGWQNSTIAINVANQSTTGNNVTYANVDKGNGRVGGLTAQASSFTVTSTVDHSTYTSRPTNTSVLYCIKYK